jgi:hypothetical protein
MSLRPRVKLRCSESEKGISRKYRTLNSKWTSRYVSLEVEKAIRFFKIAVSCCERERELYTECVDILYVNRHLWFTTSGCIWKYASLKSFRRFIDTADFSKYLMQMFYWASSWYIHVYDLCVLCSMFYVSYLMIKLILLVLLIFNLKSISDI